MNVQQLFETQALAGQVAIVTGGGRGIGQAIAKALARAGAAVVVTARSEQQLTETVAEIRAQGGQATSVAADVTDPKAVERLVVEAERAFSAVDLLVNNAGSARGIGPLWEISPEDWWSDVTTNLKGTFLCAHVVLPGMIARRRGRIVNIVSGYGIRSQPDVAAFPYVSGYSSGKAGVIVMTDQLAETVREHNVYVFALTPGLVRTVMTEDGIRSLAGQKWLREMQERFDQGQHLPPERAADQVTLLASGQVDVLSGRWVGVRHDLLSLVQRRETIAKEGLHLLRYFE